MCGEKWGHIKNERESKLEKAEADREHSQDKREARPSPQDRSTQT